MILYPATSIQKHSVSDCSGDWSTSDNYNRPCTNVARPCFLRRTDPTCEKLGITSLFAVVQWVSCGTMMNALFLQASWSITLILFAVRPSVSSCRMLGLRSSSTGLRSSSAAAPWKSVPSPRRTHPACVALAALLVAGLVGISGIP